MSNSGIDFFKEEVELIIRKGEWRRGTDLPVHDFSALHEYYDRKMGYRPSMIIATSNEDIHHYISEVLNETPNLKFVPYWYMEIEE
jgi:hypothetical protein